MNKICFAFLFCVGCFAVNTTLPGNEVSSKNERQEEPLQMCMRALFSIELDERMHALIEFEDRIGDQGDESCLDYLEQVKKRHTAIKAWLYDYTVSSDMHIKKVADDTLFLIKCKSQYIDLIKLQKSDGFIPQFKAKLLGKKLIKAMNCFIQSRKAFGESLDKSLDDEDCAEISSDAVITDS